MLSQPIRSRTVEGRPWPSPSSTAVTGLDAPLVRVEVRVGGGLPQTNIVGLPEKEVREARDRVRAALRNARFETPAGRVTVNLAPVEFLVKS